MGRKAMAALMYVECRAHCASSKGRQGHAARVEPVDRGGTNGGGMALRPPFTPMDCLHCNTALQVVSGES